MVNTTARDHFSSRPTPKWPGLVGGHLRAIVQSSQVNTISNFGIGQYVCGLRRLDLDKGLHIENPRAPAWPLTALRSGVGPGFSALCRV